MKKYLYPILFIGLLTACKNDSETQRTFVDIAGIDSRVNPGDNFFSYVNGIWYDTAVIDDDQAGVGSYMFLNIPQKKLLEQILTEVSTGSFPKGSVEQQTGDFFASGTDTVTINERGYEPIQPLLDQIEAAGNIQELLVFVAEELKAGNYSLISVGISPDQKNSSINIAHLYQAGLGLPDRDYYFRTDSSTLAVQSAYKQYIAALFELTGIEADIAFANAQKVYEIEQELAKSHKSRVELRDVQSNYHMKSVEETDQSQANISWANLLKILEIDTDSLDMKQPAYYDRLNSMLDSLSLEDWKIYLKASVINHYADILSKSFENAAFEYGKVLSGQSTQKSRAQLMVQATDRQLGFALGQLYVKRHFSEDAKKRVLDLVNNFEIALEKRINQLDWMSDSTKQKAKEKLQTFTKKIGYPDVWRTYDVEIDRDRYFENVVALRKDNFQYELSQLNKAPDKDQWLTTPSTVTAYYWPSKNEIVFPAGILQYPYFDPDADDAINYGGIGMVIGHEITHGFDDQGAKYDKDGNVKNWWTEEDYKKFNDRTQEVIDLYNTFTVLDSLPIQGALTVGENTADIGAIAIAYEAFKMTPQGQDTTRIDGLTPDQRFFYSIARIWRVKTRDEFLRTYVNTNPHSPAMWRVNGPLMNFTPFYEAFNVQPGDRNYLPEEQRIKVW